MTTAEPSQTSSVPDDTPDTGTEEPSQIPFSDLSMDTKLTIIGEQVYRMSEQVKWLTQTVNDLMQGMASNPMARMMLNRMKGTNNG